MEPPPQEQLNRYLARCGLGSRRAAAELVRSGKVTVNGEIATPGTVVEPLSDQIQVEGKTVEGPPSSRYLMLHKPVGRLDRDSSGLLLLTNDGDLAYRLTHPRYKVPKEYLVGVVGCPAPKAIQKLRQGVELEDGPTQPAEVEVIAQHNRLTELKIIIQEGRNRQVRRMLEAVGHRVNWLKRTAIGELRLGRLKPGCYRRLRPAELAILNK